MNRKLAIKILLMAALVFFVFSFTFTTGSEFSQDLGRHIKLGEIMMTSHVMPYTNLFSFTYPDFPFINHHWLPEIIYYLLYTFGGSFLLTLLKPLFIIGACVVLVWGTSQIALFPVSVLSIFFLSFLLLERSEIRPELFGWFYFAFLSTMLITRISKKYIYLIPLILLLWVNTHITFAFGCYITFLIFAFDMLTKRKLTGTIVIAGILSILAVCLNPNGIKGALYPLFIFGNYGYPIVENQNVLFLNSIMNNPGIRLFLLFQPIVLICFGYLIWKKQLRLLLLSFPFYLLTWMQIRHMPFFALSFVPALAVTVTACVKRVKIKYRIGLSLMLVCVITITSLAFITNWYWQTFDYPREFGYGLEEYGKGATDFIKEHKLSKNVFNGFDIGGYAAYGLYPQYQLFIDNRPESYPSSFVTDTYIALQQNPELRANKFKEYNIHTVLFNHTDTTPWGEQFLKEITSDPKWKTVYADSYSVVLTDKAPELPDVIQDDHYISNLVFTTHNYVELLSLAQFMSLLKKHELAISAFRKAQQVNPNSCAINKYMYNQLANTPYMDNALRIRNQFWYCF